MSEQIKWLNYLFNQAVENPNVFFMPDGDIHDECRKIRIAVESYYSPLGRMTKYVDKNNEEEWIRIK